MLHNALFQLRVCEYKGHLGGFRYRADMKFEYLVGVLRNAYNSGKNSKFDVTTLSKSHYKSTPNAFELLPMSKLLMRGNTSCCR